MLLLAAKDYVAVNSTMFFGPSLNAQPEIVGGASNYTALRIPEAADPTQLPTFVTEFALDPTSNFRLESRWRGYMRYSYGWKDWRWLYGNNPS